MNILIDGHDIALTGGIERFTAQIANAMARRGHKVFFFTYAPKGARPFCALDPDVTLVHYLFTGSQAHILGLRRQILDCKPDVFVSPASWNNHLLWCAALKGTGIPWIYSEHSDPQIIINECWSVEERSAALCAADRIHLLLENYRDTVSDCARERVRIIPNAVGITAVADKATPGDLRLLLSLGRLHVDKQNRLLLDAFALLCGDFPQWRLEIRGEGEERARLQQRIERLGLLDRGFLGGPTSTPEQQYADADIFCLPSRYEGFPNVVIEAMSCGLPVVGFAGCAALGSLVRHGETGLLAPEMTAQSLAATLRTLMADADLRRKMGENARRAAEAYEPERIFDAWEALLVETAACKGQTRLQECMAGDSDDPKLAPQYTLLRELLRRKNVLLKDSQWLRRIVRRHPLIRRAIRPAYQRLRNFSDNFRR